MASPTQATGNRQQATGLPQELTNPPATLDQLRDAQARARAAIGGPAAAAGAQPQELPPVEEDPEVRAAASRPRRPGNRFTAPEELPWEYTGPERQQIRNTNVPLTIGLLLSIVAAFLVFVISLAGSASGADPIMPAFWRALGALAVFMTLSFAASWFMPTPADRRTLLNQLDVQDRLMAERYGKRAEPQPEAPTFDDEASSDDPNKGAAVDMTISDELEDDEALEDLVPDEDEDFDDEEDDDLIGANPAPATTAG
ncbi:MAG TPA: hypothetical protein VFS62_17570 [Chloroflexota bacterium]|nr:hypothetical protein [Chloroflexota bacterium]